MPELAAFGIDRILGERRRALEQAKGRCTQVEEDLENLRCGSVQQESDRVTG